MEIPRQLTDSLEGLPGYDRQAFEKEHAFPEPVTSIRLNSHKRSTNNREGSAIEPSLLIVENFNELNNGTTAIEASRIPWCPEGFYLSARPSFTFDPLFHAGCYYVQEASSMFLAQALTQVATLSQPLRILDLCAAPGGKSTHIQSLISADSLLVSNDVIRSRANILKDNMIKWGSDNVVVTSNDPADFAQLENYFDVIVIDAPCSGSGLFRRDEEAITEWSLNNVALCSQRQQRILADTWPALKAGGILIYSTCSYSAAEDEEILDWIARELDADSLPLKTEKSWNIFESLSKNGAYGYRFWPDKLKGEGFFLGCFRKNGDTGKFSLRPRRNVEKASKKDTGILRAWVNESSHEFIKHNNTVYAVPATLYADVNLLLATLRVQYSGILTGEIFGEKLAPAHALAMSELVNIHTSAVLVDYDNAIQYLQRKELNTLLTGTGWQLVQYKGFNLGWIKVLSNRSNNYYPKELRILKDR